MGKKKLQLDPESRKVFEDAILALGKLETRELLWLIEHARRDIARAMEENEQKIIRCATPSLADRKFVHGGATTTECDEPRAELAAKYTRRLEELDRLWGTAKLLREAAQRLSMAEFGEQIRELFKK